MKSFLVATGLVLVISLFETGSPLTCLQCNDAINITDCLDKTVDCGAGEKCFLEQLTTDANQVVLNAGCRSDGVCNIMNSLVGGVGKRDLDRKDRSIVTCAKCCDDPKDSLGPCNSKLCGQKPAVNRPPKCLDCTLKASAGACVTRTSCQETQVCGNEIMVIGGNIVRYNFYCEERHLCVTAYNALGKGKKRTSNHGHADGSGGVVICNSCCIGDECNEVDCYQLQKNFTSADFSLTTSKPKVTVATKAQVTTKQTQTQTTASTIKQTPTTKPTTQAPTTQPTTQIPTTVTTAAAKPSTLSTSPTTPSVAASTQAPSTKPTQPSTSKLASVSTPVPASKPSSTLKLAPPSGSTPVNPNVVG